MTIGTEPTPPEGHSFSFLDSEGEERCECGKWLEPGYYDLLDHQQAIRKDAP